MPLPCSLRSRVVDPPLQQKNQGVAGGREPRKIVRLRKPADRRAGRDAGVDHRIQGGDAASGVRPQHL